VIVNLTQNLERGIKAKLEALGKTWTDVVEELPLPKKTAGAEETATTTKTSSTDAVPGVVLEAGGADAAAIARAQAARSAALEHAPAATGITEILDKRVEESHDADRGAK
jgi:hypothetical protein